MPPSLYRIAPTIRGWDILLALAIGFLPGSGLAATLDVGEGKPFAVPSAAAAAARVGDRIAIGAGSYSDCAVWTANDLRIEGDGEDATVITGTPCGGKALFIARGNTIVIRGLTLANPS